MTIELDQRTISELTDEAWNIDYVELLKETHIVESKGKSYEFSKLHEALLLVTKLGGLKGTGVELLKISTYKYPDGMKTFTDKTSYVLDKQDKWTLQETTSIENV